MKTVFDEATRNELISRINTLDENSRAQWGKMNVCQMLKHGILVEEMFLGKKQYKRMFLGRLLGKIALKNLLKDDSPMGHNAPTGEGFKIKETGGDIAAEKKKWIALITEYAHFSSPEMVHWFFGTMTREQLGFFAYKHTDHHLRQFNS